MRSHGFSLTELLVTLAIVVVLAGLAIPTYSAYVKAAKLKESAALLTHTAARLEQRFLDRRSYASCDTGQSGDECACHVTPASDKNFSVSCKIVGLGYELTASNKANAGLGAVGDFTYTLNNSGARATTKFAGAELTAKPCWLLEENATC
ncbi:MAG: prepilin-type N-terminal cleavage/methylation domain-containing protein [Pseudomonadota bacterium]